MRRRDLITLIGGAAAWPLAARAQPPGRMRRIGILMGTADSDVEGQARFAALRKGLEALGWSEGQNIRIDVRWAAADDATRIHAAELVALRPDVIVANGTPATTVLRQQTQTIPVVFTMVTDPVGQELVKSLAHPGGNMTGFTNFEFSMGGKWLGMLKEMVPRLERVVVPFHPRTAPYAASFLQPLEVAAASLAVSPRAVAVHDESEIERVLETAARESNCGLIVVPSIFMTTYRDLIISLAARYRVPALYAFRYFATNGGLISYGTDSADIHTRAADYVDRMLKGTRAADLPVQQPTKFELVINLKTAKALGIEIPATLLARADEVIE
jgi:putative ABC transport system substrate-binding protein